MNVDSAWKCYEDMTAKVSELSRQLAFAGIAVIWIFKDGGAVAPAGAPPTLIPRDLILAMCAFVAFLSLDYLQYLSASVVWRIYARHKEIQCEKVNAPVTEDFSHPAWISWPYTPFFYLKIVAMVFGQIVLFSYLAHRWLLIS